MHRFIMVFVLCAAPAAAFAQAAPMVHAPGMVHTPGMTMGGGEAATALPTQPGQAAYGSIAEIAGMLEADSTTDWSKVNLEALRQHLIDMNAVTMNAEVQQTRIAGGLRMDVTGEGRTMEAIRRMVTAHTPMLDGLAEYVATSEVIPHGARLTVRAEQPGDTRTEAKIQGLGFIGLLTEGQHHAPHHLALAKGQTMNHPM